MRIKNVHIKYATIKKEDIETNVFATNWVIFDNSGSFDISTYVGSRKYECSEKCSPFFVRMTECVRNNETSTEVCDKEIDSFLNCVAKE